MAMITSVLKDVKTEYQKTGDTILINEAPQRVIEHIKEVVREKGGEVFQAVQQGLISATDIQAELAELTAQPKHPWRTNEQAITVFKSVGFASLDLIAAEMVFNVKNQS